MHNSLMKCTRGMKHHGIFYHKLINGMLTKLSHFSESTNKFTLDIAYTEKAKIATFLAYFGVVEHNSS